MPPSRSLPILLPTGFKLVSFTHIALLWSSYGHIYRLTLSTEPKSLILKSIHPPALDHPSESHLRKLLSYDVERWFYLNMSARLPSHVKTARSYPLPEDQAHNLLLEDLSGEFPHSASGSLDRAATTCVLDWLAGFHGTYFRVHQHGKKTLPTVPPPNACAEAAVSGVWERGTYYYLETRREELEETDQEVYFWLFPWIEKVNDAIEREIKQYGTIVHGDVKGANIVFNRNPYPRRRGRNASQSAAPSAESTPLRCALYDFQYVGLGLPTLDLVYFLGTSVDSSLLSPASEKELLQAYHAVLLQSVPVNEHETYTFDVFWHHWELAIVDWYRFMAGWGFWGNDNWAEGRAQEIVHDWQTRNLEHV